MGPWLWRQVSHGESESWRPAEVGHHADCLPRSPTRRTKCSAGEVATSRSRWWKKAGGPRTEEPSGIHGPSGDKGEAVNLGVC